MAAAGELYSSTKALELELGNVHGIVPAHCHGHQKEWPANSVYFSSLMFCLQPWWPLRRGNKEQKVARWWCLEASAIALLEGI